MIAIFRQSNRTRQASCSSAQTPANASWMGKDKAQARESNEALALHCLKLSIMITGLLA